MNLIKSRTFWSIVVLVAVNTVPQLRGYLSPELLDLFNVVLGALATYFHITPSQKYNS